MLNGSGSPATPLAVGGGDLLSTTSGTSRRRDMSGVKTSPLAMSRLDGHGFTLYLFFSVLNIG